ncbi:MAG: hypothetical protein mread185_000282 [Mycoplasmataceae bacterium]|nr:MAG: hypothetical protein mread185_000282 [Mycoplasmataceae bacterium]
MLFLKKNDRISDELKKLEQEILNLQKEKVNKDRILVFALISFLVIWGFYGIFKLLKLLKNRK